MAEINLPRPGVLAALSLALACAPVMAVVNLTGPCTADPGEVVKLSLEGAGTSEVRWRVEQDGKRVDLPVVPAAPGAYRLEVGGGSGTRVLRVTAEAGDGSSSWTILVDPPPGPKRLRRDAGTSSSSGSVPRLAPVDRGIPTGPFARLPLSVRNLLFTYQPAEAIGLGTAFHGSGTRGITRTRLWGNPEPGCMARYLAQRTGLKHLELDAMPKETPLTEALGQVAGLASLRVDPANLAFEPEHLVQVAKNNPLVKLELPRNLLSAEALAGLQGSLADLTLLEDRPGQDTLEAAEERFGAVLAGLGRCEKLTRLEGKGATLASLQDHHLPPGLLDLEASRLQNLTGRGLPKGLVRLRLHYCPSLVPEEAFPLPELTDLALTDVGEGHEPMVALLVQCPKLARLHYDTGRLLDEEDLGRLASLPLTHLTCSAEGLEAFDFSRFTRLQSLTACGVDRMTKGKFPASLTHLTLEHAFKFTGAGLPEGLRYLSLSEAHAFRNGTLLPASLEHLVLDFCDGKRSEFRLPATLRTLDLIDFRMDLPKFQELIRAMPRLEQLVMKNSRIVPGFTETGRSVLKVDFLAHPALTSVVWEQADGVARWQFPKPAPASSSSSSSSSSSLSSLKVGSSPS